MPGRLLFITLYSPPLHFILLPLDSPFSFLFLPPKKVKSLDSHGHGCPVLWVDYGFKCTISGSVGSGGEALMVCVVA